MIPTYWPRRRKSFTIATGGSSHHQGETRSGGGALSRAFCMLTRASSSSRSSNADWYTGPTNSSHAPMNPTQ